MNDNDSKIIGYSPTGNDPGEVDIKTVVDSTLGYGSGIRFGELIEEGVRKAIEREDEFVPILKNYIGRYMEDFMSKRACDDILYKTVIERDERIKALEEEVRNLKNQLSEMTTYKGGYGWSD